MSFVEPESESESARVRRGRRAVAVAVGISALVVPMLGGSAAWAAKPLVVDDDGAQCGSAAYTSIADALDHAVDGDRIQVCPGVYREPLHITKSVTLVGPVDAVSRLDCFAAAPTTPGDLDTTQVAVLEPLVATTEATESLVMLDADGVELAGFVVQGVIDDTAAIITVPPSATYPVYIPAVAASDAHSGYRIHHNLIRSNTLGVELGSSGDQPTRLDNNCLRDNEWAVANQRMVLDDAVLVGNTAFRTLVAGFEIGWSYRAAVDVTVRENVVEAGRYGILVENSRDARIAGNHVASVRERGIWISGASTNVEVIDNVVEGGFTTLPTAPSGIATTLTSSNIPLARSTGVVIRGNTVSGIRATLPSGAIAGFGVAVGAGSLQGAVITGNVVSGSGSAGITLVNNNPNNVLRGNLSSDNGTYGIRLQGALSIGNDLRGNTMHGNALFDASDITDANPADGLSNTWLDNECVTDEPAGALCLIE
jgi:parallel beta-helix repeat protein